MKPRRLPKVLYVRWSNEEVNDVPYLIPAQTPDELNLQDEAIRVGIYELKRTAPAVNRTEVLD
jgi:hypothetical protein